MFPTPEQYLALYYQSFEQEREKVSVANQRRTRYRRTLDNRVEGEYDPVGTPQITIPGNASNFGVYAAVRATVLDKWIRVAYHENNFANMPGRSFDDFADSDSESSDDSEEASLPAQPSLKFVNLGVSAVFEIIRETRKTHPELCAKSLTALLQVLERLDPESFKYEPAEVTMPLLSALFDMATSEVPEISAPNDGKHLTALACSSLLALLVAIGDTDKILLAVNALLTSSRGLTSQNVMVPVILTKFQRKIYEFFANRYDLPTWLSSGILWNSVVDAFRIRLPVEVQAVRSLCSDGQYLYLLSNRGLFKVGSGMGSTVKGHVYMHRTDFYPTEKGWLGFCNDKLYLRRGMKQESELLVIERDGLLVTGALTLDPEDASAVAMFADAENLGVMSVVEDDSFVIRTLNPRQNPPVLLKEQLLSLLRHLIDFYGIAGTEGNFAEYKIPEVPNPEDMKQLIGGNKFALMRTASGQVLYCGQPAALGLKGIYDTTRWIELSVQGERGKIASFRHIALSHDGTHAVLVTEDGEPYFIGTSKKATDAGVATTCQNADNFNGPKKMVKVHDEIIFAACNNATTALITKGGHLLMFGKDACYVENDTGLVKCLQSETLTQVALGKAHTVALNSNGEVFTFGINNKNQCGFDFPAIKTDEHLFDTDPIETKMAFSVNMCKKSEHNMSTGKCRVCRYCLECTGYGINCRLSSKLKRIPGEECGCGVGSTGCSICGSCSSCSDGFLQNLEKIIQKKSQEASMSYDVNNELLQRDRKLQKKSNFRISRYFLDPHRTLEGTPDDADKINREVNQQILNLYEKEAKCRWVSPRRVTLPNSSPVVQIACGSYHTVLLLQNGMVNTFGSNHYGQLGIGTSILLATPQLVGVSGVQIAAGSNHTAILTNHGDVYTFGNKEHGQLGRELDVEENSPTTKTVTNVEWWATPAPVAQMGPNYRRKATWIGANGNETYVRYDEVLVTAAGLNKSDVMASKDYIIVIPDQTDVHNDVKSAVIRRADGYCNTFLDNQQVQFVDSVVCIDPVYNTIWAFSLPYQEITCYNILVTEIPNSFEPQNEFSYLCSGMKPSPSVLSMLKHNETITHRMLTEKNDGVQTSKMGAIEDVERATTAPQTIKSPPESVETIRGLNDLSLSTIANNELAIPVVPGQQVTRHQAALHLLGCLDVLNFARNMNLKTLVDEDADEPNVDVKEDYMVANRFTHTSGRYWGYTSNSRDSIRFRANCDLMFGGVGLYAGDGDYSIKVRVYDAGKERNLTSEKLSAMRLMAEKLYVHRKNQFNNIDLVFFNNPIYVFADRWYLIVCRLNCVRTDSGIDGRDVIYCQTDVHITFERSLKSNNGTDEFRGQIPQLFFKKITLDMSVNANLEPSLDNKTYVRNLSHEFCKNINKDCFQSLVSMLRSSWCECKQILIEKQTKTSPSYTFAELERVVYIIRACLRLLRSYINDVYPPEYTRKVPLIVSEDLLLIQSIGDARVILRQILTDHVKRRKGKGYKLPEAYLSLLTSVYDETHDTFLAGFHAFYPTSYLKWNCLHSLVMDINEDIGPARLKGERLLSAVLVALSSSNARFPRAFYSNDPSPTVSPDDGSRDIGQYDSPFNRTPPGTPSAAYSYPLLVEQMVYRSQTESGVSSWAWNLTDIVNRLLKIVAGQLRYRFITSNCSKTSHVLSKHICEFFLKLVADMTYHWATSVDEFQQKYGHGPVYNFPTRFSSIHRYQGWKPGEKGADAISFSVNQSGVSIVGVAIFVYHGQVNYQLDLFKDNTTDPSEESSMRWTSLATIKGRKWMPERIPESCEVFFDKPVPIKKDVVYAFRLRMKGDDTMHGKTGFNSVVGPDGTKITFYNCALSYNGTTVDKGQFIYVIYNRMYVENPLGFSPTSIGESCDLKHSIITIATAVVDKCTELLNTVKDNVTNNGNYLNCSAPLQMLADSYLFKMLVPNLLARVTTLVNLDPKTAVQFLDLCHKMLPPIASLNLLEIESGNPGMEAVLGPHLNTSTSHTVIVESDHPYKRALVKQYNATFPNTVKWMSVEFDPACSLSQIQDTLQILLPCMAEINYPQYENIHCDRIENALWPAWPKISSSVPFPRRSIILPGNRLTFYLSTASSSKKAEDGTDWGFKCTINGYELPPMFEKMDFKHLESEVAYFAGLCASNLLSRNIRLPFVRGDSDLSNSNVGNLSEAFEKAKKIVSEHAALLSKGLDVSKPYNATVVQALEGNLPLRVNSIERTFLNDFITCKYGTPGGRLAHWLQPDSRVDFNRCVVEYNTEDARAGVPMLIKLTTKNQYNEVVFVGCMDVSIKIVPTGYNVELMKKRQKKQPVASSSKDIVADPVVATPPDNNGNNTPDWEAQKDCDGGFKLDNDIENEGVEMNAKAAIGSKDEETLICLSNNDGVYKAVWIPFNPGTYSIVVEIDGDKLNDLYKVEVKPSPQGVKPPHSETKREMDSQTRHRIFVGKFSAGLRIRALPSLQSKQVGIIPPGTIISFVEELKNDDGIWIRLSVSMIKKYCTDQIAKSSANDAKACAVEAWCMQYHQILNKTLLTPVVAAKNMLDKIEIIKKRQTEEIPGLIHRDPLPVGIYRVVNCGASCHVIRSTPSLSSPVIGMLTLSNIVRAKHSVVNSDGVWIQLDMSAVRKFCVNDYVQAWTLAIGKANINYFQSVADENLADIRPECGFMFTLPEDDIPIPPKTNFTSDKPDSSRCSSPFIFGEPDPPNVDESAKVPRIEMPSCSSAKQFHPVSVKDMVKSFDSKTPNNNGSPLPARKVMDDEEADEDTSQSEVVNPPIGHIASVKTHFTIGAGPKDSAQANKCISPKMHRKAKSKRVVSPGGVKHRDDRENAKSAMKPSLAESLRAIFAALLWHEGIVYDAMACASFLKFHPNLPKKGAMVVTRHVHSASNDNRNRTMRHSLDVSNVNYMDIPSSMESLKSSIECKNIKEHVGESSIKEDDEVKPNQTVNVLPPALKALVHLWDKLLSDKFMFTLNQLITNAQKEKGVNVENVEFHEPLDRVGKVKMRNKYRMYGRNRKTLCDLCGIWSPQQIDVHMRLLHPGCGAKSVTSGYSIDGRYQDTTFEGDCGGSDYLNLYLLCQSCRNRYITLRMLKDEKTRTVSVGITTNDCRIMTKNAKFLLELNSMAGNNIPTGIFPPRKSKSKRMPSVSEDGAAEHPIPFVIPNHMQCFAAFGAKVIPYDQIPVDADQEVRMRPRNTASTSRGPRPLSEASMEEFSNNCKFHRSVSMGMNENVSSEASDLNKEISQNFVSEHTSSLLCHPSAALQRLVPTMDITSSIVTDGQSDEEDMTHVVQFIKNPVITFISKPQDNDLLRYALKQALRVASCRVYATQAFTWFLRSVTQPTCLHDLLWWFHNSLLPADDQLKNETETAGDEPYLVCEHPLSDITIAGEALGTLPSSFHKLLETISDLMPALPKGSALQLQTVRCWPIRFTSSDHTFLHRLHVFSNISKIIAPSDDVVDDNSLSLYDTHTITSWKPICTVETVEDITPHVEIKVKTNKQYVEYLTDLSTETCWETTNHHSCKDPRYIYFTVPKDYIPTSVHMFFDPVLDAEGFIQGVSLSIIGKREESVKLRSYRIDPEGFTGWSGFYLRDFNVSNFTLVLKADQMVARVRQVRVLGYHVNDDGVKNRKIQSFTNVTSQTIKQRECHAETLSVFKFFFAQVFNKLLKNGIQNKSPPGSRAKAITETTGNEDEKPLEDTSELREHMVGILFSQNKLSNLQQEVIDYVVHSISLETTRMRDDWELALTLDGSRWSLNSNATQVMDDVTSNREDNVNLDASKSPDEDIFQMMSMTLALSGSPVGLKYLSMQLGLLKDLLSLLHIGTVRIKRQVVLLLKRLFCEISPETFAKAAEVERLPSREPLLFDDVKDDRNGLLEVLLAYIAKALIVQIKNKDKTKEEDAGSSITTGAFLTFLTANPTRWYMKGEGNIQLAMDVIQLIKDLQNGKMGESWQEMSKAAISETILSCAFMDERLRVPRECFKAPQIWLALAALCLVVPEHSQSLTTGRFVSDSSHVNASTHPTCQNHDDGKTFAILNCNECGNLCVACDQCLHLPLKMKHHIRRICKEEEKAIKVDNNEGCGRVQSYWLQAYSDSRSLKAIVEFRRKGDNISSLKGQTGIVGTCRFCGTSSNEGLLAISDVCADESCQELSKQICTKILTCGHPCGGVSGETKCLPCLFGCSNDPSLKQDADDLCIICFTDPLRCAPSIQLTCGHVFHLHCVKTILSKKWIGPRISFSFLRCPICKAMIENEMIQEELKPLYELYKEVLQKAVQRHEFEMGTNKDNLTPEQAFEKFSYYMCCKCKKPYYGGEARCDAELNIVEYNPEDLCCPPCTSGGSLICYRHGSDNFEYKCRFCCSVAMFFCFGTTHYCAACHTQARTFEYTDKQLPSCPAGPNFTQLVGPCPLNMKHPPTGFEFPLGCSLCRRGF